MALINISPFLLVLNFIGIVLTYNIRILIICQDKFNQTCYSVTNDFFRNENQNMNNINHSLSWIFLPVGDDLIENIEMINDIVKDTGCPKRCDVMIAVGNEAIVNAATTTAQSMHIPVLVYDTSIYKLPIYSDTMVALHADRFNYGRGVAVLAGNHILQRTCVITEEDFLNDGFTDGFQSYFLDFKLNNSQIMLLRNEDSIQDLFLKLQDIQENGYRFIIVHLSSRWVADMIRLCKALGYLDSGFVWIFTPISLVLNQRAIESLPLGLLALEGYDDIDWLLRKTLASILNAFNNMVKTNSSLFKETFISFIASTTQCNENSDRLCFDSEGRRSNVTFKLLNKVTTDSWQTVGYFSDMFLSIDSIYWPGNTLFGPFNDIKKVYRVVTRVADPFVYMKSPIEPALSCFGDFECWLILDGDPKYLPNYVDNFPDVGVVANVTAKRYCCGGIAIEMFDSLAAELNFHYIIYLQNDTNYGTRTNGTWDGMIGDVISEAADIIIGAFSVTSARLPHIIYTEPFFYSGFSMVIATQNSKPSIDAFLRPFATDVWFLIFFSATVTGIAASLLEWNSPFGLNPWARKRKRNFTLGSGMVMAHSILFGHTVQTKTPKSWPSKWLQNIWAALSIFIVASYTANLAAYLAGKTEEETINSVNDPKLKDKRITAIPSSAVVEYLGIINTHLLNRALQYNVNNEEDAIAKLRQGEIDVFLDDTPIQQFTLSKYDVNCSTKLTGREFGENFYAFGLSKSSVWLRDKLSSVIMNYVEGGYVEILRKKHIAKRSCERYEINTTKYSLDHTGGLFIMLLSALVFSMILMLIEHAIYKYLIPYIRKKPSNSRWKTRQIEYISQRIFRSIMSERLVNPKQTAREMVKLMKDRNFSRLFLKNELKAQQQKSEKREDKGLRLMNLTENLMKMHKTKSETSLVDTNDNNYEVFSTKSSGELYKLSNGDIQCHAAENDFDVEKCEFDITMDSSEDESKTYETDISPAVRRYRDFNEDNQTRSNQNNFTGENGETKTKYEIRPNNHLTVNRLWHSYEKKESDSTERSSIYAILEQDDKEASSSCMQCKYKNSLQRSRFGTWPVLAANKHFKYRSLDKQTTKRNKSSIQLDHCQTFGKKCIQCSQDASERTAAPLLSSFTVPENKPDYYRSALKMKDNRVKSTIRRHAIAKYRRHSSSMFDGCAIDALNKEDLLVMWKKSEIELQTKLNRVTLQNAHLKRLLRIVEDTKDRPDQSQKGTISCTRL